MSDTSLQQEYRLAEKALATGLGRIHLAGVCGIGMAGLAVLLKDRGYEVDGCDTESAALGAWLEAKGISVASGHDAAHLGSDLKMLIRTPAVPESHPEIQAASDSGLPVLRRGVVLPRLLTDTTSIAVCGTHGKTSTATFIAQLLRACGVDTSYCIGGDIESLGGCAGVGTDPMLVVEADESDGTLQFYRPTIGLITNVEYDHMEHFADEAAFTSCFEQFAAQCVERLVVCGDDERALMMGARAQAVTTYGIAPESDYRACDVEWSADGVRFALHIRGTCVGGAQVNLLGMHNVRNLLGAITVLVESGVEPAVVLQHLASVALPKRRLETVVRSDVHVISDYAHHPTEIAAVMTVLTSLPASRRIVVYQPHRYTRTLALGDQFPPAFEGADEVILIPVYPASEAPIVGGTIWDLYERFRTQSELDVTVADSLEHAWSYLRHHLKSGDLLAVLGAGDVECIATWAKDSLQAGVSGLDDTHTAISRLCEREWSESDLRRDHVLGTKTGLHLGGRADLVADMRSEEELVTLLTIAASERIPVTVIGAGRNSLVHDFGVRGIVVRLSGDAFAGLRVDGDTVVAGAGVPLNRLASLVDEGKTGLVFLEAIPGTVGGATRMNAGAYGAEMVDFVEWVRVIDYRGRVTTIVKADLGFRYRCCAAVLDTIVIEVGLTVPDGDLAEAKVQGAMIAEQRAWQSKLRSVGSVFKNPPDDHAGRLIEAAGLKGFRIGGACFAIEHANFINADKGARSADVQALIRHAQVAVREQFGIELEMEVIRYG